MSQQTIGLASTGDGSSMSLVYDDATMLASSIDMQVPADAARCTFEFQIDDPSLQATYHQTLAPGDTFSYVITPQLPISTITNWKGRQALTFQWLVSYGCGFTNELRAV